jgi:hypothetical protein
MITVYNFLHKYCELRELPTPTIPDLESCGRLISHHFKYYWAIQFGEGIIPDCGFLVSQEGGRKLVVQSYPEIFKQEMAKRIDLYYLQKSQPKPTPEIKETIPPPKTTRKRKIIPPVQKVASVKPSNIQ